MVIYYGNILMHQKCKIAINLIINIAIEEVFSGHAAMAFTVVTARTIASIYFDLRIQSDERANQRRNAERKGKRASRECVCTRPRSFVRARRHLKLARPSPFYFSRCARTMPSRGTANCHDVTFLGPPLTSVSYACVRACVHEQMF